MNSIPFQEGEVRIFYKDAHGYVDWRRVIPETLIFGSHSGSSPEWMLVAFDLDKQVKRSFAMRDIFYWRYE